MKSGVSVLDSILFVIAVFSGLLFANLILTLFKSNIRISILGSLIITIALLIVQLFL
jgi:hypothetical protein